MTLVAAEISGRNAKERVLRVCWDMWEMLLEPRIWSHITTKPQWRTDVRCWQVRRLQHRGISANTFWLVRISPPKWPTSRGNWCVSLPQLYPLERATTVIKNALCQASCGLALISFARADCPKYILCHRVFSPRIGQCQ